MDSVVLLWLLDNRWLFGLPPVLPQFLPLAPCALSIVVLSVTASYKVIYGCQYRLHLIDVITCSAVLIVLQLTLFTWMMILRKQTAKQLSLIEFNKQAASGFINRLNQKRAAWSWLSLFISLASIVQLALTRGYLGPGQCTNTSIQVFFYVNVAFWIYICGVVLMFWIRKISYLLVAWKFPKCYLQSRSVLK